MCDERCEPDPTAGVPGHVLAEVDGLADRETFAFERLGHVPDGPARHAIVAALADHDPDLWCEWTIYADVPGYRAYVGAFEAVLDVALIVAGAYGESAT